MKASCNLSDIVTAVKATAHAVASQTTLPILQNIKIEAKEGALELTTTDLNISVSYTGEAHVSEQGSLAVPAKLFHELITSFSGQALTMETQENFLIIRDTYR